MQLKSGLDHLKKNWKSGVTVSLISIPLSISLAVASGVTPLMGILTAMWAGFFAAVFAGSNFNIVGPTGALSGVIATYAIAHGAATVPVLAVLAGILILIAYALKLERYLILIPSSVIHGFTLGVAFIIGLNQFNSALGLKNIPVHEKFFDNVIESFKHVSGFSFAAVVVFFLFLVALFLFKKFLPKIPGAIVLAPVGILLGYLGETGAISSKLQTLGGKFGSISFQFFSAPSLTFTHDMVVSALVIALVAILETMLSAKIADGMTRTKHNGRKEMLSLGIANIASGLAGGIPATAALARTSLNIRTGASHRTSAIVNAILVAVISSVFLIYFRYIPMAVIAAILVYVAIQMIERKHFIRFYQYERSSFFVALLVAAVTIVEDPIVGILVGVSISLLIFTNKISHGHFDAKLNKFDEGLVGVVSGESIKEIKENADILLYSIRGKLCYLNSRAHVSRFEEGLTSYKYIVLRLREVYFIDLDGIEALDEIIGIAEERGQKVLLTSIDPAIVALLKQCSKKYDRFEKEKLIFEKTQFALESLGIKPR